MLRLSKALKVSDNVTEAELQQRGEALKALEAMASDNSYDGILASVLSCQNSSMIFDWVRKSIKDSENQFGATFLLRELAGRSSDIDTARDSQWLSNFTALSVRCCKAVAAANFTLKDTKGFQNVISSHRDVVVLLKTHMCTAVADLLNCLSVQCVDTKETMGKIKALHINQQCALTLCDFKIPKDEEDDEKKAMFEEISKSMAIIREFSEAVSNLCNVADSAITIFNIFNSEARDLRKAICVFAVMDAQSHLFDESLVGAYRSFTNAFSVAEVARNKCKEERGFLADIGLKFVYAIVSPEATSKELACIPELSKFFDMTIHRMHQLVSWSATAQDDALNLTMASHLSTLLKYFKIIDKVKAAKQSEGNLDDMVEFMSGSLGEQYLPAVKGLRHIHSMGHDQAIVKLGWIFDDGKLAEQAWQWIVAAHGHVEEFVLTVTKITETSLKPLIEDLLKVVIGFEATSSDKEAKVVKDHIHPQMFQSLNHP